MWEGRDNRTFHLASVTICRSDERTTKMVKMRDAPFCTPPDDAKINGDATTTKDQEQMQFLSFQRRRKRTKILRKQEMYPRGLIPTKAVAPREIFPRRLFFSVRRTRGGHKSKIFLFGILSLRDLLPF